MLCREGLTFATDPARALSEIPLAAIPVSLPEPAAHAIRDRAREAAAAYETPAGIEFPGAALIASARRS